MKASDLLVQCLEEEGIEGGTLDEIDNAVQEEVADAVESAAGAPYPESQEAALEVLRSRHPDHAILAEEGEAGVDRLPPDGTPLWVVDPLDGTTNYLHGHPNYAASVALVVDGVPVVGCVDASATGERWWARRGGRAGLGGDRDVADQAQLAGLDQDAQVVFAEAQRRDDGTASDGAERPFQESALPPQEEVEQREDRFQVVHLGDA